MPAASRGAIRRGAQRRPPLAPGSLGVRLRALLWDPLSYVRRLAETREKMLWLRLPGGGFYVLQDLEVIDEVLVKHHRSFVKDSYTHRLRELLGNGLVTAEGPPWRRQRRLIQPAFHRKRIVGYADEMTGLAEAMVEGWGESEVRDVHRDLMGLTLEIVAKSLFGADVTGSTKAVGVAIDLVMQRHAGILLPLWLPTPMNRRVQASIDEVTSLIDGIIRERRRGAVDSGRERSDLLSLLFEAEDEDGGRMDDRQIRDECITLFLAGHETTALTLSYTLFLLAQRPDLQDMLAAEIEAVVGDRPAGFADVPELHGFDRVIKESMRLYPPAWSIGRRAIEEVELGGYRLPKGGEVAIFMWALHRDPDRFPEPEAFRPERWTPEFERALPRHAYMPFGGGPRSCIGKAFANIEAVLVLVAILRRYRLRLAQSPRLRLKASITMRPRDGVRLRLRAR